MLAEKSNPQQVSVELLRINQDSAATLSKLTSESEITTKMNVLFISISLFLMLGCALLFCQ